jgi:hypothetical protein
MNKPRLIYRPRLDATTEGGLNALASVYAFVLKCGQEKRKAGVTSTGEEAKGLENEIRPAPPILPR